jgi:hypothetical protein
MLWGKRLAIMASLAMFLGIGCASLQEFQMNFLSSPAAGRERILSGSVENAVQSTQGLLRDWGLEATSSKKGEEVCIHSSTKRGREFRVVLTRTTDSQTRVRLEWDGAEDDELGMCLLTQLEHLTSVRTSHLGR